MYDAIAVYILASKKRGTLYIGVTSNLIKRIHEHKTNAVDGFTKEHNVKLLVYYELCDYMQSAIQREKRLKKYKREQKIKLIEAKNAEWKDLYDDVCQ